MKSKYNRTKDSLREVRPGEGVGDDLSSDNLDDLWTMILEGQESDMSAWWSDKPQQILYRLLLRLTRVELENAELRGELEALKHSEV